MTTITGMDGKHYLIKHISLLLEYDEIPFSRKVARVVRLRLE